MNRSPAITEVPCEQIRMDGGTQPRAALDFDAIDDYSEEIAAGAKFPPVIVYYDGADYWLADGFHRVKAAWQAGRDTVEAEVHQGTLEDAQWYSFSANTTNGLRRTNRDKQRAVKAALLHPKAQCLSDRLIAEHVAVHYNTVAAYRKKLTITNSDSPRRQRTGRDGRTINTAKIGGRPSAKTQPAQSAAPSDPQPGPDVPPARRKESGRRRSRPDSPEHHLSRVAKAMEQILACPLNPNDFHACLTQQPTQATLIKNMENLNEYISQVLAETRRTSTNS